MPKTIISKMQENPHYFSDVATRNNIRNKQKKVKYKKITFKITDAQKDALEIICRRQKTTPIRYLKSVIKKQTARYKTTPLPVSYVTENQLQLFDLDADFEIQNKKK